MLTLGPATRVFVAVEPVDMRGSFDFRRARRPRPAPSRQRRRLVETWQRSTTSTTAFARARGVKPATIATWVRREERPAWTPPPQVGATAVPPFLPVQRAPLTPSPERAASAVTVAVGDHVLRFADAPPAAWFAAVVRELVSC